MDMNTLQKYCINRIISLFGVRWTEFSQLSKAEGDY